MFLDFIDWILLLFQGKLGLYHNSHSVNILDENGNYFAQNSGYYYIKPGNYYLVYTENTGDTGVQIKFGLIEYEQTDFNIELKEIKGHYFEEEHKFINDDKLASGLFKYWFTLEEDAVINYSYYYCLIYDVDGNLYESKDGILELKQGTYYFVFNPNAKTGYVEIGIKK